MQKLRKENGYLATLPSLQLSNVRIADKIVDDITIKIPSQLVYKHRLMMLDVLANADWNRPIYFTGGSFDDADYLWMKSYLQLDGVCYKLVPIKT